MKKLLAVLLALVMPFSAMAETYGLSLSVATDETIFTQYAKEALRLDPAYADMDLDKLAAAVEQILDGFGVSLTVQEDAAALDIQLGGGSLLDLVVHVTQDALYMTSSLLPGYALREKISAPTEQELSVAKELASMDWQAVSISVEEAVQQWASVIEPTVMQGMFSGDAYEGGTRCTTWVLSDIDIAALVSAGMTDELRAAVTALLIVIGENADEILSRFDAINDKVADEDAYIYMLRIVENDAGDVVGMSLTVIQEMHQVATVSLGLSGMECRLVVGLGANEDNYWWEISGKRTVVDNVTCFTGNSREWLADKSDAFAYVRERVNPLSNYEWRCSLTQSGKRYLWDGQVNVWNGQAYEALCSTSGVCAPETGTFCGTIGLGTSPYEPLKLQFSFGPVDAIASLDADAEMCDLSDPEDALLSERLQNQLAASFMARLIKRLPMDLLLSMPQLTIPE